ncbi:polyprenol monophosphomannose synthase [Lacisediminihabitans profunda]|uniref:Polyprenol monophosphomannose synthase n=1 Tax=Lacisediminihabitans profunda TaxID=2594790 RepID=A0A5C8UV23_9MICO|nr:polyprenol monophosphomannose synthase [Lacisediminihabitans profunda]TXN31849.1 polyprenol monophosphomannose synthase [Lacisediminihabitans profunda]
MAETLVILPTYNEIESLASVIGRIRQSLPLADVLVVDDSSPDGTGELAETLAAGDPGLSVLHRAAKDGLGRAYLAGFRRALERDYLYVVEIDADGSHDPAELPAMLELARHGADLVIGSRWVAGGSVRNWPWLRQAISRLGNAYARAVLRSDIRDITAGFRVFRADALRCLDLSAVSSQGYCFQVELAWRLERSGGVVVEHPITFVERAAGRSKMHLGIVVEALLRVTVWGITARGARRRS